MFIKFAWVISVCQFLKYGVSAVIGSLPNPEAMRLAEPMFYHYTMPHIATTGPFHAKQVGTPSYTFYMKPSKSIELQKIVDFLKIYEYHQLAVLYDQSCG